MVRPLKKINVGHSIEFAYQDSGPPPSKSDDYLTIVAIHGHTFHSGTFGPMLEIAGSLGYRVIAPNRRLYPGSTPYTVEEIEELKPTNKDEYVLQAYLKQGKYLLLFIDNIIKEYGLKKVVVTGWSLGSGFLSAMTCSLVTMNIEEERKARIRQAVKSLVWWDPPTNIHGVDDPPTGGWTPLYDNTVPLEERGTAFNKWVTQYFPHPRIEKKDYNNLIYDVSASVNPPTYSKLSLEELLAKIDLTAGLNGDNYLAIPTIKGPAQLLWKLTFLTSKTRKEWGNTKFCTIYGEQNPWNVVWTVWQLEDQSKKAGLPIVVKGMRKNQSFCHGRPNQAFI